MLSTEWVATLVLVVDFLIRIGLAGRVIMRRLPVGQSLAWLVIIVLLPIVGMVAYLLFGELRLGRLRARRAQALHEPYTRWLRELRERADIDWSDQSADSLPLARLIEVAVGIPALSGNSLQLLSDWQTAMRSMIDDIDQAERTCHLEFYIWSEGGLADEVAEALLRAVKRGVICRVLLDDVGSRPFLRSPHAERLKAGGVQLHASLAANLLRMVFVRFDLRMHRKIVVIDGRIGYTGSLNLVDPRYFKQNAGVGQWIDAMVRLEGRAVEPLAITFLEDWALESGDDVHRLREFGDVHRPEPCGDAEVQIAPSGPAQGTTGIDGVLLATIYGARSELILTTPYFVPDESLVKALVSAAQRGVNVSLIIPDKVDSNLVDWASWAFMGDLVQAGVNVLRFTGGLLHTKSVTADGERSLFGSLNLDPRSLHLNFEITLAVFDRQFAGELRDLQMSYAAQSTILTVETWAKRGFFARLVENSARLFGPLL